MLVLSAAEMQACDRATTEQYGIPSVDLMRNAARSIAEFARLEFPRATRVTVLCGRGNNGGDGMMAARLLADAGLAVTVIVLGSPDGIKGDAAEAWRELEAAGSCRIHVVGSEKELAARNDALETDLIIDAVVGTGFKPPLKGLALAALEWVKGEKSSGAKAHIDFDASAARLKSGPVTELPQGAGFHHPAKSGPVTELLRAAVSNQPAKLGPFAMPGPAPVLAIDLPSGWPADETKATVNDPVFPADAVVTFTAPKPAHVFGQLTRAWTQPVMVAPIGSPDEAIVSDLQIHWAGSAQALAHAPRNADANKGRFGHVLVVGGSFGSAGGKAGAPAMAALAAMRAGAGLVTAAVPAPALAVVSSHAPELMTWPLLANDAGEASHENLAPERIAALTKGITVLAVGPGLGQSDDTARFCIGLLEATSMPAVIDADALNILAKDPNALPELTRNGRTIVITPHPAEMARLAGISTAEVQANRLEVARDFARRNGVIVVLKGARTLIARPDGAVGVNTTGNPGMAKGGSGDLLTGMVAGLLAQYPDDAARAVEAAVFLHGLAADLAVKSADEHTLLATDSLRYFSQAFRFRSGTANGYVWLQGLPGGLFHRESGSLEAAE